MSDHSQLEIAYDGPLLRDNSMNVLAVAPAMMALGTLFREANATVNGDQATISVNVRAMPAGSFEINYDVVRQVSEVLLPTGMSLVTANALRSLIFGGDGLVDLIKWLRARKAKQVKVDEESYDFSIEGTDEIRDVSEPLKRLHDNPRVRKALLAVVLPVALEGIEVMLIKEEGQVVNDVREGHMESFEASASGEEIILDEMRKYAFSIQNLSFKEGNRWRLAEGDNTYSVQMKDDAFIQRINNNEIAFSKGDLLTCNVRVVQRSTADGIKVDYDVLRVLSHTSVQQGSLFNSSASTE